MTQHLDEITNEIAGLVVAGVDFRDMDEIIDAVTLRAGEIVFQPEAEDFITNLTITRTTLGHAPNRSMDLEYDLTYVCFYAPVGVGRGLRDFYAGLAGTWQSIVHAIINHDFHAIHAIRCEPQGTTAFGRVTDPLGNEFYGFRLVIHILEFMRE